MVIVGWEQKTGRVVCAKDHRVSKMLFCCHDMVWQNDCSVVERILGIFKLTSCDTDDGKSRENVLCEHCERLLCCYSSFRISQPNPIEVLFESRPARSIE
jgi:hypothetical protein